ncbi:hypothetical protein [Microbacterium halotolerans]|uniref:hypothetical protein n=1 Tax=Microbacterium halotolerans TaxID=246613 RepID=UPI000E6ADFA6|nr:hypothetical protein [Microbacterium halotolerans]
MTENAEGSRRGMIITVVIVAVAVLAVIVFAVSQLWANDDDADPTGSDGTTMPTETATADPEDEGDDVSTDDGSDSTDTSGEDAATTEPGEVTGTNKVLPERMNGQEAIDALGDKIDFVAERNNKTVDELKDLLLRDKSAHISTGGFIVYIDSSTKDG